MVPIWCKSYMESISKITQQDIHGVRWVYIPLTYVIHFARLIPMR